MGRLDLHPMPGKGGRGYVVDVQADLLSSLSTRTVVPLLPRDGAPPPIGELNPVFDIAGEPHVLITQAIATIDSHELKRHVGSLAEHRDAVLRALDILLFGF